MAQTSCFGCAASNTPPVATITAAMSAIADNFARRLATVRVWSRDRAKAGSPKTGRILAQNETERPATGDYSGGSAGFSAAGHDEAGAAAILPGTWQRYATLEEARIAGRQMSRATKSCAQ